MCMRMVVYACVGWYVVGRSFQVVGNVITAVVMWLVCRKYVVSNVSGMWPVCGQ